MFKAWDHAFWERPDWIGGNNLRDRGVEPFWMRDEAVEQPSPATRAGNPVWVLGLDVSRFSAAGWTYCRQEDGSIVQPRLTGSQIAYLMERVTTNPYLNAPISKSVAAARGTALAQHRMYDPVTVYGP